MKLTHTAPRRLQGLTPSGILTVALALLGLTACSKTSPNKVTAPPTPVASVAVSPTSANIKTGATVTLAATPKDADGAALTGRTVTWSSDTPAAATVDADGVVTAVAVGSATITAACEGKSGTSAITVSNAAVASVTVTPASATVEAGTTKALTATPKDAGGHALTGRVVTWSSDTPAAATVNSSGVVTGVAAGSATITATCEGQNGTAAITVVVTPVASVTVSPASASVQAGSTVSLSATPKDAGGNPLPNRVVTWSSDTPAAATVDGNGVVTGVAAGSATITATCGGKTGTSAITVTAAGSAAVLIGAGDIAIDDIYEAATAKLIEAEPSATAMAVGDCAYPDGTASDFAVYDKTWGAFKARTKPCPGNHEYHTSGASGYFNYFGALAGPSGLGYYSYDLGTWHIISLDSEIDMSVGSPQEKWLRADLAAHPTDCTLAYWHQPRFSSGDIHGDNPDVAPLWQALQDYGAEIIVNGHEHEYERFAPQDANGTADPTKGIREFVVGTGGANLYTITNVEPNSEAHDTNTYGVLKLTLGNGTYSWQFIPIAGQTYTDSGSGTCHK